MPFQMFQRGLLVQQVLSVNPKDSIAAHWANVNDQQLKSGVNTSSAEFLQALQDISNNPSAIYNYPNFYHLCTVSTTVTPTPTPTLIQRVFLFY